MEHRHIAPSGLSLAAIDDIIDRGGLADWIMLLDAAQSDPHLTSAIRGIASHGAGNDEASDRYASWLAILGGVDELPQVTF